MTYALVISGVIQSTRNTPPPAARRLDTGAWVTPLDGPSPSGVAQPTR